MICEKKKHMLNWVFLGVHPFVGRTYRNKTTKKSIHLFKGKVLLWSKYG